MATNYRFHCPYCERHMFTTSHPTNYDSPLKNCSKCGKTYIDPYSIELALKPYEPRSTFKLLISNVFTGVGSAFFIALIVLFVTKNNTASWLTLGIGSVVCWLLWFVHSLLNRNKEEERRLKKWQESDRRLQDSEYAAQLENLGYNVPAQYLPPNFKHDYESTPYQRAKVSKVHFT